LVLASNLGWIGVDLGTHSVKVAQAVRTSEGIRLRHAAVIQRPTPWSDADALALDEPDPSWPEILAALECGDFRGRNAACLLPMNVCELRGLKIPQGDVHERRAMIASELADDDADLARPLEFDYWELGGEKGIETTEGFNVNVMSITRPWIDQVAEDCQRVRLDCWAVDGGPLAMARAVSLAAGAQHGERAVAVDWGFSNTTITIVGRGRPLYARRLHDCPFRKCLAAIQDSLGISRDQAQYLVDVHGVTPVDSEQQSSSAEEQGIQAAITAATAEVTTSLVEQIGRTIRFVEQQRRCQHPTALWLMGGGASVRNIGPHLSAALGMPVSIWGLPPEREAPRTTAQISATLPATLFGPALALSALAWRAV
jgi:Tfp pilus assembly PilM family ATPase